MESAGVILVDKDQGWSSSDVVAKLRRLLGARKVGHCGTLDPMATGLLVICVNSATKLADLLSRHDKDYLATIELGRRTDTDDAEGRIIAQADPTNISLEGVEKVLRSFVGRQSQIPPGYSAIKVDGVRSYRRARKGETFALKPREVIFHKLELLDWQPPDFEVSIRCSAGTYIRALARDVGETLGVGAHLSHLRRIRSGQFGIDRARTIDDIERICVDGSPAGLLMNCLDVLVDLPMLSLPASLFVRLTQGQIVQVDGPIPDPSAEYLVVVQDPPNDQVVLARQANSRTLAPAKLIAGNPVRVSA